MFLFQQFDKFRARNALAFHLIGCDPLQNLPMVPQDLVGLVLALLQQPADLLIRLRAGLLGAGGDVPAVQVLVLRALETHGAEIFAHAVLSDHLPGQVRGALNIVGRAGGGGAEFDHFGGPAAQEHGDLREQLVLGQQIPLFLRGAHGVAQRPPWCGGRW